MRLTNIELCRILAMLGIVTIHSLNPYLFKNQAITPPYLMYFGEAVGIVGVNVFLLISGYFSIRTKKKAVFNLLYCCLFYYLISLFVGWLDGNLKFKMFLFVSKSNWFIPVYLGLMLLSPVLNKFIDTIDKKSMAEITAFLVLFDIWNDWFPGTAIGTFNGYRLLHFMTMYFVGRYIGLYGLPNRIKRYQKYSWVVYLGLSLLIAVGGILLNYMGKQQISLLWAYNNPIIIISSVAFFVMFSNLEIKDSKLINNIAKSVIGVLLFHACGAVYSITNRTFACIYHDYSSFGVVVIWLSMIVAIFTTAVLIDQVRILTFNKLIKQINI